MSKRLEFEVHGPFDIPLDETRRTLDLNEFWSGDLQRLSDLCGCYVVAVKSVKGKLMPCYIGLTKRQRFRDEIFNGSNVAKYGNAIAPNKRHRLVMFLITPPDRKGKVSRRYIRPLEDFLIQAGSARNPDIQNW